MTEQAELVVDATVYLNGNGTGSPNTGTGFAAAVGYRYGFIAPYVAYDYFRSSGCDAGSLSPSELDVCRASIDTANSRNFKAGVNLFFNKNLNHVNVEFGNQPWAVGVWAVEHHRGRLRADLSRSPHPGWPAAGIHQLIGEPDVQVPPRAMVLYL